MDITIQDLSVSYPSDRGLVRVLRHADLFLPHGKITALVGESGSGKSILGAAILGLLDPSAEISGHIQLNGEDLLSLSESELNTIRGRHIGWIAQDPIAAMNPVMKVGKQVTELVRFLHHRTEKEMRQEGIGQIGKYGLPDPDGVYQKYAMELSGGMAQRVLTAMVTMPHPEWLIADEPTKGLDAFVRRQVCDLFRRLREEGTGFLLITHDLRLAEWLSDYIGIMYSGEILEYGKTSDVFRTPCHPYTRMLIEAQPGRQMAPIPGMPPDLSDLPDGCIFGSRCPMYEKHICDTVQTMIPCDRDREVRCIRQKGEKS